MSNKKITFGKLEKKMAFAGFWDNPKSAQPVVSQLSALKSIIDPVEEIQREVEDLQELFEMAAADSDKEELTQLEDDLSSLLTRCEQIELTGLLSKPEDSKNCFFSIHAGAGGTESCDWVNMLLRMYSRYFEKNKYKFRDHAGRRGRNSVHNTASQRTFRLRETIVRKRCASARQNQPVRFTKTKAYEFCGCGLCA